MRKKTAFLFFVASVLCACNGDIEYTNYANISHEGWDRSDSLIFNVPPIKSDGDYNIALGLRTNNAFPFKRISVIVEQTVYPSKTMYKDTIDCHIYDDRGRMLGNGISYHQYMFGTRPRHYHRKDSIRIYIRHDMKREIIAGITSVGLEMRMK